MPHFVFIVNPTAGKGGYADRLYTDILGFFADKPYTCEIFLTEKKGDALGFVRQYPGSGKELCFVACGGDGTLHEVVNGAAGRDDCSVGLIPCGSGNDYVKNFGDPAAFFDLQRLVDGKVHPVDLLECAGELTVNLCNIGFDARVASNMAKFKKIPLVSGSLAYSLSVLYSILGPLSSSMTIETGDGEILEEKLVLAAAANGFSYGGGYYPAPDACTADGIMEFCGIRKLSRLRIPQFIGIYKRGKHLDNPKLAPWVLYRKGQRLTIRGKRPLVVCMDGEIRSLKEVPIRLLPSALSLWLPAGCVPRGLVPEEAMSV